MDFMSILRIVQTATTAARQGKEFLDNMQGKLDSNDESTLRASIQELQQANDALTETTLARLDAAAQDGQSEPNQ